MTMGDMAANGAGDTSPQFDRAGLKVLTETECRERLGSVSIGRIVFTERALPAVHPVTFVMDGLGVVIRTIPGSALSAATRNAVVAFEVDSFDLANHSGWNVTAIGRARLVTDADELSRLAGLPLRSWGPNHRDHFIRIEITTLQGRVLPV